MRSIRKNNTISNAKGKVLNNTVMLYCMTAAKYVLPVVIAACLTRRLGPAKYGVLTFVQMVMGYFLMLFDFGFNYSATRSISRQREDKAAVQRIFSQVMTSKLLLVCFGAIILAVLIPSIEILKQNVLFTVVYFLSKIANIFLPDFIYRGMEDMKYVTLRYLMGTAFSAVCIVVFVRGPQDLLWIPVFYGLGTLLAAVFALVQVRKKYGVSLSFSPVKDALPQLKESGIYFVSTAASTALGAIITFAMGFAKMPEVEIAYWGVAMQVVTAILALYDPITSSMFPHVAKDRDYGFVIRTTVVLSTGVLCGCVLSYFLSDFVVHIIAGAGYETAAVVFRYLLPAIFFAFPTQMLGFPLLGAMGDVKYVTASTVTTAGVVLVGIIFLISVNAFTLSNIAIVKCCSEFVMCGLRVIFTVILVRKKYRYIER